MQHILDGGADINARDATEHGHIEILDLLRERKADFKIRDLIGGSVHHGACARVQTLVIPGLLQIGLTFIQSDILDRMPPAWAITAKSDSLDEGIMHHVAITHHTCHQLAEILSESADRQDTSMLKWLLDQSDAYQIYDALNNRAECFTLHVAAGCNRVDIPRDFTQCRCGNRPIESQVGFCISVCRPHERIWSNLILSQERYKSDVYRV